MPHRLLKHFYPIPWVGATALATLAFAGSCGGQQSKDPYAGDTTYQRRLAYQQQMSYKVPMDSQVHLYERLATASKTEAAPLTREFMCEGLRSAMQYGVIPAANAASRALDSLRKAKPEAFARATAAMNNADPLDLSISYAKCHALDITPAPESLNVNPVPEAIKRKRQRP